MRLLWPIIVLAVGLGFLHVAISIVLGPGIASALVAGIGIAYAAFNLLLGKPKDDPETKQLVARLFAIGKVTYTAIALVWLSAAAMAAYPLIDGMVSETFTVTVIDEQRRPADSARVEVSFGGETRNVPMMRGVGTVKYYPSFTARTVTIAVDNKGARQSVEHRMDVQGRYDDLLIAVWSGQPPLSVDHLTVSGLAIDAFLHGNLPDDLRERYPRVSVLRGPVYETAREFLSFYRDFENSSAGLTYSRAQAEGGRWQKPVETAVDEGDGERWLEEYRGRVQKLRFAKPLTEEFELDFSNDLLGAPIAEPLPEGFLAVTKTEDEWAFGIEAVPDAATSAWIAANLRNPVRGPNGALSLELERLLTAVDLRYLLEHDAPASSGQMPDPAVRAYMRYMIRHGLPEGLVRAVVHLEPGEGGCDMLRPHLMIELPEPELRFTILKNEGDNPIKIDALILTVQMRDRLQRSGAAAAQEESRLPFDVLAPGEAVLIPRELSIKAIYTDEELVDFHRPADGPVAAFRLLPRLPVEVVGTPAEATTPAGFDRRPSLLRLPTARLRIARHEADTELPDGALFLQRGPSYLVGPSASEIDYVVNGVRIRARTDTRVAIRMIGGFEMGSCPFVFAQYPSATRPLNLGQIITDQIGLAAKGRDTLAIPRGFTRLEIQEREDEVSYLDSAKLSVPRSQGVVRYPARGQALKSEDGRYLVMRKGDRVALDFGYVPQDGDGEPRLEVNGYYDLVRAGNAGR